MFRIQINSLRYGKEDGNNDGRFLVWGIWKETEFCLCSDSMKMVLAHNQQQTDSFLTLLAIFFSRCSDVPICTRDVRKNRRNRILLGQSVGYQEGSVCHRLPGNIELSGGWCCLQCRPFRLAFCHLCPQAFAAIPTRQTQIRSGSTESNFHRLDFCPTHGIHKILVGTAREITGRKTISDLSRFDSGQSYRRGRTCDVSRRLHSRTKPEKSNYKSRWP